MKVKAAMKKIVLLCSAGMSTSLLVNKMREAAKKQGYECSIDAYPIRSATEHGKDADIVLLGPQVRFQLRKLNQDLSCPVEAIDPMTYGRMDGEALLKKVREVLGD
jgi:PTS system cellobiose-specific IIB component